MGIVTRVFSRMQLAEWDLPEARRQFREKSGLPVVLDRRDIWRYGHDMERELVFRAPDDGLAWKVRYWEGPVKGDSPWSGMDKVIGVKVEPHTVATVTWVPVEES